ncbi:hypothetical protein H0H93_014424 [Arthromyces matolae]|nr:hypothetical protein H0H93_014424 [Arthromyces matolae]
MSENSVARWNAIPTHSKHARSDDDDDDDDVSIVSRTPSPSPMDVDHDFNKYDEYVRGVSHEVITVETKIKPTNKGFAMLARLGWTEGQPLGVSGEGRVDPIPFQIKSDLTGLGKISQDVRMIETTVSQRRGLDSERQQKETEEQRRSREETVARKFALQDEISVTLKPFYCLLCDKQFKNVAQYDEHTNSYAHHHKARFRDMQANVRVKHKDEVDKRREKERKREEKELRKIAAANGIKMAKPTTNVSLTASSSSSSSAEPSVPIKRGGWAAVSSPVTPASSALRTGWTSVGSPTSSSQATGPPVIRPEPSVSSEFKANSVKGSTPTFRTAGWTSLDSGSSDIVPNQLMSPPQQQPASSVPLNEGAQTGWSRIPTQSTNIPPQPLVSPPSLVSTPPPPPPPNPEPLQHAQSGWQQFQKSKNIPPQPVVPPPSLVSTPLPPTAEPLQHAQSGWQQFQKSNRHHK